MPSATTPCSQAARSSGSASFSPAHSSTANCSTAAAPQNSVVMAIDSAPSRSAHSVRCAAQKPRSIGSHAVRLCG
jgi:hypothetical protein